MAIPIKIKFESQNANKPIQELDELKEKVNKNTNEFRNLNTELNKNKLISEQIATQIANMNNQLKNNNMQLLASNIKKTDKSMQDLNKNIKESTPTLAKIDAVINSVANTVYLLIEAHRVLQATYKKLIDPAFINRTKDTLQYLTLIAELKGYDRLANGFRLIGDAMDFVFAKVKSLNSGFMTLSVSMNTFFKIKEKMRDIEDTLGTVFKVFFVSAVVGFGGVLAKNQDFIKALNNTILQIKNLGLAMSKTFNLSKLFSGFSASGADIKIFLSKIKEQFTNFIISPKISFANINFSNIKSSIIDIKNTLSTLAPSFFAVGQSLVNLGSATWKVIKTLSSQFIEMAKMVFSGTLFINENLKILTSSIISHSTKSILSLTEYSAGVGSALSLVGLALLSSESKFNKFFGSVLLLAAAFSLGFSLIVKIILDKIGSFILDIGLYLYEISNKFTKSANKLEKATWSFGFIFAGINREVKGSLGSFDEWNDKIIKISQSTNYAIDDVYSGVQEALLLGKNLQFNQQQIQKYVDLALDLGTITGDRLQDVVISLGQAFQGSAQSVQKYGLHLNEMGVNHAQYAKQLNTDISAMNDYQLAQLRLNVALEQSNPVKGKAIALSETMEGLHKKISATTEQLQAKLGTTNIIIRSLTRFFADFLTTLTEFPQSIFNIVSSFIDFSSALFLVVGGSIKFALVLTSIMTLLTALPAVMAFLNVQLLANTKAVVILADAFTMLAFKMNLSSQMLAITSLKNVFINLGIVLKASLISIISQGLKTLLTLAQNLLKGFLAFAKSPFARILGTYLALFTALYIAVSELQKETKIFTKLVTDLSKAFTDLFSSSEKTNESILTTKEVMANMGRGVIATFIFLLTLVLNTASSIIMVISSSIAQVLESIGNMISIVSNYLGKFFYKISDFFNSVSEAFQNLIVANGDYNEQLLRFISHIAVPQAEAEERMQVMTSSMMKQQKLVNSLDKEIIKAGVEKNEMLKQSLELQKAKIDLSQLENETEKTKETRQKVEEKKLEIFEKELKFKKEIEEIATNANIINLRLEIENMPESVAKIKKLSELDIIEKQQDITKKQVDLSQLEETQAVFDAVMSLEKQLQNIKTTENKKMEKEILELKKSALEQYKDVISTESDKIINTYKQKEDEFKQLYTKQLLSSKQVQNAVIQLNKQKNKELNELLKTQSDEYMAKIKELNASRLEVSKKNIENAYLIAIKELENIEELNEQIRKAYKDKKIIQETYNKEIQEITDKRNNILQELNANFTEIMTDTNKLNTEKLRKEISELSQVLNISTNNNANDISVSFNNALLSINKIKLKSKEYYTEAINKNKEMRENGLISTIQEQNNAEKVKETIENMLTDNYDNIQTYFKKYSEKYENFINNNLELSDIEKQEQLSNIDEITDKLNELKSEAITIDIKISKTENVLANINNQISLFKNGVNSVIDFYMGANSALFTQAELKIWQADALDGLRTTTERALSTGKVFSSEIEKMTSVSPNLTFIDRFLAPFKALAKSGIAILSPLFQFMKFSFVTILQQGFLAEFLKNLNLGAKAFREFTGKFIGEFLSLMPRVIENLPVMIYNLAKQIPAILKEMLVGLITLVFDFDNLVTFLYDAIVLFITGIFDAIVNPILEKIKKVFFEIGDYIASIFTADFWSNIGQDLWDAITKPLKRLIAWFTGTKIRADNFLVEPQYEEIADKNKEALNSFVGNIATGEFRIRTANEAGQVEQIKTYATSMTDNLNNTAVNFASTMASNVEGSLTTSVYSALSNGFTLFNQDNSLAVNLNIATNAVKQFASGGFVSAETKQTAETQGNSLKNDKIPALLSEGEYILPRSITQNKEIMAQILSLVQGNTKAFADGGYAYSSANMTDIFLQVQQKYKPKAQKAVAPVQQAVQQDNSILGSDSFGDAVGNLGKTIVDALIAPFKNLDLSFASLKKAFTDIFAPISDFLDSLNKTLDKLLDKIDKLSADLGAKAGDKVGEVAQKVASAVGIELDPQTVKNISKVVGKIVELGAKALLIAILAYGTAIMSVGAYYAVITIATYAYQGALIIANYATIAYTAVVSALGVAMALASSPIVIIIALVAAFVLAIVYLYRNIEMIKASLAQFADYMVGIWEKMKAPIAQFGAWFMENIQVIMYAVAGIILVGVALAFAPITLVIAVIAGAIYLVITYFDQIKETLSKIGTFINDNIIAPIVSLFSTVKTTLIDPIITGLTAFYNAIILPIVTFISTILSPFFTQLSTFFKDIFIGAWANVKLAVTAVLAFPSKIANKFKEIIPKIGETLSSIGSLIFNSVTQGFKGFTGFLSELIDKVAVILNKPKEAVQAVKNAGAKVVNTVADKGRQFGKWLGFAEGGFVDTSIVGMRATQQGNSIANDKIPALLSQGEYIIPRSIAQNSMLMAQILAIIHGTAITASKGIMPTIPTSIEPKAIKISLEVSTNSNNNINISVKSDNKVTIDNQELTKVILPALKKAIYDESKQGKSIINIRGIES